ncbi:MAG: glycerophosphodiester phosphodiesterase [Mycobacterium sp.]|mgnify:CR=1 FL=1
MAASRAGRIPRALTALVGLALLAAGIVLLLRPASGFDVQGHRGARGMLPENTIPAFTYADDLGVTTLEMDTKVTKDGVLVVTHDSVLNPDLVRDASGAWVRDGIALNSLTLAQVEQLDVGRLRPGSAYAKRFPDQRPIDGTRMPTLREVLDTFRDRSAVRFNVETKIEPDHPGDSPDPATFSRKLVDELRSAGVDQRTTIQSFDWRTLKEVQRIAPEIPTVALTEADTSLLEDGRWTAGLRLGDYGGSVPALVAASGADIWSPDSEKLSAESVRDAHDRGLSVVPWTVNEPKDIDAMRGLGVDGVISDYPKRVLDAAPRGVPSWIPGTLLAVGAIAVIAAGLPIWGVRRSPSAPPG